MKRLGLIAGMLVLLFAVGSFAMQGGAESDDIPVLQTQVADLQTRVAALEGTAVASPVSVEPTIVSNSARLFMGTGPSHTATFGYYGGYLSFELTCADADHGSLVLVNKDTGEMTPMASAQTMTVKRGVYFVDVQCVGDWALNITAK